MRMNVSLEAVTHTHTHTHTHTQYNLKNKKEIGNKYNILYLCDFEV